jgi:hypothetical protein
MIPADAGRFLGRVSWEQLMVPAVPPSIDKGPVLEGLSLHSCIHCRARADARDIQWRGILLESQCGKFHDPELNSDLVIPTLF